MRFKMIVKKEIIESFEITIEAGSKSAATKKLRDMIGGVSVEKYRTFFNKQQFCEGRTVSKSLSYWTKHS